MKFLTGTFFPNKIISLDDEFSSMITGHEIAYIRNPLSKTTLQTDLNKKIMQLYYYNASRRQFNWLLKSPVTDECVGGLQYEQLSLLGHKIRH